MTGILLRLPVLLVKPRRCCLPRSPTSLEHGHDAADRQPAGDDL